VGKRELDKDRGADAMLFSVLDFWDFVVLGSVKQLKVSTLDTSTEAAHVLSSTEFKAIS